MKSCPREPEVGAAVQASSLDAPLREHAAACAVCRDVVSVGGFLATLATQPTATPLPEPEDLLRRARLLERLFTERAPVENAIRRLTIAEVAGILVSAMAVLGWLTRAGSELAARLGQAPGAAVVITWPSPLAVAITVLVALLTASLPLALMWRFLTSGD